MTGAPNADAHDVGSPEGRPDDRTPRRLTVESSLAYDLDAPTTFLFAITAAQTERQSVHDDTLDLPDGVDHELVPYGETGHRLIRLVAPPGQLTMHYRASVDIRASRRRAEDLAEPTFAQLPAETLPYVNPSRYCESDELHELAHRLFGDLTPGYDRVRSISDWVGESMDYIPGVTDASTSAADALVGRAGVCRDFAHVAIALCRALGIPARYVSGYGLGVEPPDFHGFLEVFVGDDWYLLDPTGMAPADGLVRVGVGRDAADVAFATFVGSAQLSEKLVSVTEEPGDDHPSSTGGDGSDDVVSTA